jgi:hypothetical protein
MDSYRLEQIKPDYWLVMRGLTKVAIVFPGEAPGSLKLYPHPDTYPDLYFTGLPAPLLPDWMTFSSMSALREFLAIQPEAIAA